MNEDIKHVFRKCFYKWYKIISIELVRKVKSVYIVPEFDNPSYAFFNNKYYTFTDLCIKVTEATHLNIHSDMPFYPLLFSRKSIK